METKTKTIATLSEELLDILAQGGKFLIEDHFLVEKLSGTTSLHVVLYLKKKEFGVLLSPLGPGSNQYEITIGSQGEAERIQVFGTNETFQEEIKMLLESIVKNGADLELPINYKRWK